MAGRFPQISGVFRDARDAKERVTRVNEYSVTRYIDTLFDRKIPNCPAVDL
jgi:hypothetical protein